MSLQPSILTTLTLHTVTQRDSNQPPLVQRTRPTTLPPCDVRFSETLYKKSMCERARSRSEGCMRMDTDRSGKAVCLVTSSVPPARGCCALVAWHSRRPQHRQRLRVPNPIVRRCVGHGRQEAASLSRGRSGGQMAVRDVHRVMMGARVQRARRAMAVRGRCASTSPRRLVPGRDHHTTGGGSRLRPERIALRLVMHLVECLVV